MCTLFSPQLQYRSARKVGVSNSEDIFPDRDTSFYQISASGAEWMRRHRAACIAMQHTFTQQDRAQLRSSYTALLDTV
jgi:hypothetical protein